MVTRTLRRWRDRGAAAVEFALCVPLLVLLIFGSIEFGLAVQARTSVGNAAREGVRMASLVGAHDGVSADGEVRASATSAMAGITGTKTVTTTCVNPDATTCIFGSAEAGAVATVVVTLNYTGVTGMFSLLTNTTLTSSSYMRIEA
jgi:Flp pilus assembly protein TadG